MNVKITFLNDDLDKEIYMEQLEMFIVKEKENKVCKLIKALYDLKQVSKYQHEDFDNVMLLNYFKINKVDKYVYI